MEEDEEELRDDQIAEILDDEDEYSDQVEEEDDASNSEIEDSDDVVQAQRAKRRTR